MARSTNIYLPDKGSIQVKIKLKGDWQQLNILSDNLGPSIQKGYDEAVRIFSTKLLKIVKDAVKLGIPPKGSGIRWEEKSPNSRNPDHLYWVTGLYYRSMGIFSYKGRTYVGLRANGKASNGDNLSLIELATLLERGSKGAGLHSYEGNSNRIPPRPLWAPAFNKSMGGISNLRKRIITSIRQQLYRKGIKANQVKW